VVLKATNVDGVYDCDPKHNAAARMHRHVSYDEVARDRLSVMDATAITLCAENAIPGKMLRSRQRVSHLLFESGPQASFGLLESRLAVSLNMDSVTAPQNKLSGLDGLFVCLQMIPLSRDASLPNKMRLPTINFDIGIGALLRLQLLSSI
jgi:hypothetical protein